MLNDSTDDLETVPCDNCGATAKEVVYAEKNIRRGWHCANCGAFQKAYFRERLLKTCDNNKGPE